MELENEPKYIIVNGEPLIFKAINGIKKVILRKIQHSELNLKHYDLQLQVRKNEEIIINDKVSNYIPNSPLPRVAHIDMEFKDFFTLSVSVKSKDEKLHDVPLLFIHEVH